MMLFLILTYLRAAVKFFVGLRLNGAMLGSVILLLCWLVIMQRGAGVPNNGATLKDVHV